MGDVIGFRQQLSTTSFEAFEQEIAMNCPVHTWMENASFMRNLAIWSMPFWLDLLSWLSTRSSTATWWMQSATAGWWTVVPVLWILFSRTLMLPSLQVSNSCWAIHSTAVMHHTTLADRFLIRIASSCEIFMILFIVNWYLGLNSFPR